MWYSIMYLPLAEATVITFLMPSVAGYICHLILKDPFTRKEQMASFAALVGVVLIAHPTSLLSGLFHHDGDPSSATSAVPIAAANLTHTHPALGEEATDAQRLGAVGVSLIGVLGGSGAVT